jgi:hypothetical protein
VSLQIKQIHQAVNAQQTMFGTKQQNHVLVPHRILSIWDANVLDVFNHLFGIQFKRYANLDVNNLILGKLKHNHVSAPLLLLMIQDQNVLTVHYHSNGNNQLNLVHSKRAILAHKPQLTQLTQLIQLIQLTQLILLILPTQQVVLPTMLWIGA